jgi:hypothetical protein
MIGTIEVDKHESSRVKLTSDMRSIVQFEIWLASTENRVLVAKIVAFCKSPDTTNAESGPSISIDKLTRGVLGGPPGCLR